MADSVTHGRNGYTREEWLYSILHSGEVTRIGQHLALVIYHLSDYDTNTAELSLRDLERITGWTRQAIRDHIYEIDTYVKVRWGLGRAKSQFELQGIIAEEMDKIKAARSLTATVDTSEPVAIAATVAVNQIDATVTGNDSGQPDSHNAHATQEFVANHVATTPNEGGTIGGEIKNYHPNVKSLSQGRARLDVDATAPPFTIEDDGSFAGQTFEIPQVEMLGLQNAFTALQFPAELIAADRYLANEFETEVAKTGIRLKYADKMARLHQYLAKLNASRSVLIKNAMNAAQTKAARADDTECMWQHDQLVVSGSFANQLLEICGDQNKMNSALLKIGDKVSLDLKGSNLRRVVKALFAKQIDYDKNNERRTSAAENRNGKTKTTMTADVLAMKNMSAAELAEYKSLLSAQQDV